MYDSRHGLKAAAVHIAAATLALMVFLAWPSLRALASSLGSGGGASIGFFSVNGSTNNTAMSFAARGVNNGCSPSDDFQRGQGGIGVNSAAEGIAGCVNVPVGSTNLGANGVQGSASNASTTTNAVGGYFPSFASAAGSGSADANRVRIWGINPLTQDGGFSNVLMTNELDFNISAAGTKVLGLQFTGAGTQDMSADSAAAIVGPIGTTHQWPGAYLCADGATSNACVQIGATSTGNNVSSQKLRFISRTAGGVNNITDLSIGPGTGNLNINNQQGGGISFQQSTVNQAVIGAGGSYNMLGLALASLAPTTNGTVIYCTDCLNQSNPCTGASTGAIAKRLNGAWDCR